jgi:2-keto-4-pentenoate hydratase/2-oxohepta-3-ene-1,7-dioic acid hydratase in catechol pathway
MTRWIRYATATGPVWGEVDGAQVYPLTAAPYAGGARSGAPLPLAGLRLLAPAVPSKLVCVGRNYAAHAAELGNDVPAEPLLFLKAPSSIIGPGDTILLPSLDRRTDEEAELAIVIGKTARRVSEADALDYVLGYTIANDVSDRVLQKADGQWGRAKSFDTFCPVGPCIVSGLDPDNLPVRAEINGRVVQESNTALMVHKVRRLIAFISGVMTLEPGDLILTGTPAGVSALAPGDTVRITIEGIGELVNPVAAAD